MVSATMAHSHHGPQPPWSVAADHSHSNDLWRLLCLVIQCAYTIFPSPHSWGVRTCECHKCGYWDHSSVHSFTCSCTRSWNTTSNHIVLVLWCFSSDDFTGTGVQCCDDLVAFSPSYPSGMNSLSVWLTVYLLVLTSYAPLTLCFICYDVWTVSLWFGQI